MTLSLQHPFSMIVSGPSGAGKSFRVAELIKFKDKIIYPPPHRVYFCYSEWQPLYESGAFSGVNFVQGMIELEQIDTSVTNLLIIDDLMTILGKKEGLMISELFTKHSHHKNLSVVLITQNMFERGVHMRNCQLNSHYQMLFKNPRDRTQISYLARQMYPNKWKFMLSAYNDAVAKPYGYLFVDLKQDTEEWMRLRTGIFPSEVCYVYLPKSKTIHLPSNLETVNKHEQ